MQIGLRGHPRTLDWLQPSYDYGYNVVTMAEYRARGAADVIAQARDVLAGRPVYITFDLDCLDPSVAPAVSNIEPGVTGFSMDEAVELLHAARGLNIIGGDVALADARALDDPVVAGIDPGGEFGVGEDAGGQIGAAANDL